MSRRAQAQGTWHTLVSASAAVLCGLVLSANLGNLLHLATHAHTYCAEHHQIVHTAAANAAWRRPPVPADDPGHAVVARAPATTPEDHAHCAHAQLCARGAHLAPRAPGEFRAIATGPVGAPHPAGAMACSAARCLRQAPKTSPPAG